MDIENLSNWFQVDTTWHSIIVGFEPVKYVEACKMIRPVAINANVVFFFVNF